MDIKELKISAVKPYDKNPRKNDDAVQYVAESIKQFGFKVPIVIDKDNIIVAGHTRHKAAKLLGLKKVPCIVADDLTDEQIKAFRIADNKVSEKAEWDFELLQGELDDLLSFDMADFGFDIPADVDAIFENDESGETEEWDGWDEIAKQNENMRTVAAYNMELFDEGKTEGRWQMPVLAPCDVLPQRVIGFNYAMTSTDYDAGIHFYLDDYQFERVWNNPGKYIEILSRFACVLTPSFSLYMDMAEPIKIYNTYRGRLLGQIMQYRGLNVIPLVYWADEKSFDYCFDGLPENAVLSTLTMGTSDPEIWPIWEKGMKELIKRKKPKTLLLYGNGLQVDFDFGDIEVIYFENEITQKFKNEV